MSEEDCGICGSDLNEKFNYSLQCNHVFHYDCLMKSFSNISYNKKYSNFCPYCRKNSDHLPLVNGLKKVIPGVHCGVLGYEIDIKKKELKEKFNHKCEFTLKRGKNKGNHCGKTCILGYGYCKSHLEQMKKKHGDLLPELSLPTSADNSTIEAQSDDIIHNNS
jgi:hypothetical protein